MTAEVGDRPGCDSVSAHPRGWRSAAGTSDRAPYCALLAGLLFLPVVAPAAPEPDEPVVRTYVTASARDGVPLNVPATEFSCNDKIYGVVDLTRFERARHDLHVVWKDPSGKERERAGFDFQVTRDQELVWVWLRLDPPQGAWFETLLDSSFGMKDFAGEWAVSFYIDRKPVAKNTFKVLC